MTGTTNQASAVPVPPAATNPSVTTADRDALARERIVRETDRNFFVEAGAGSGKTTLLVHRMTAMVEQGKDIREICAITFTKAAANEFYERFRALLSQRSRPETEEEPARPSRMLPPATEESRARCAEALKNIDLCFMGTIDAFCNRILGEHPVHAGLPSELRLASEEELNAYLRQAYVRISRGEYGEELRQQADLLRKLHSRAETVFATGAAYLLAHRNVGFAYEQLDAAEADRRKAAYEEELREAVNALYAHPEAKHPSSQADHNSAWANLSENRRIIIQNWDYRYDSIIKATKGLQGLRISGDPEDIGITGGNLFEDYIDGRKKKKTGSVIPENNPLIQKMRDLPYDVAMTLLTACLPVLEQELRSQGLLTYFDYLYYLRNALREDAKKGGALARYIASQHSYYLIDEFQDTDPLQAEVFFYLAAETPQEDWAACRPRAGSLFIVGDPKQSIYRFRSADVTSFLRVKALFEDPAVGETLALSRNFRSTAHIRSFFNRSFNALLPAQTNDQSRFEPIPVEEESAAADPVLFGGIYAYPAFIGKAGREQHPEETDEKQVVRIIRQLTGRPDKYRLRPRKEQEPRAIRYSDFMVITATKAVLTLYMREMEAAGVPYRVEGNVPFAECPALTDTIRIFAALANPKDTMMLYRALHCGLIGLEDAQIEALSLGRKPSFWKREGAEADLLTPQAQQLRALQKETGKLSASALFEQILERYRVFETESDQNAEILWYVLEKLRSGEATGLYPSHAEAAAWLETLLAEKSKEERALSLQPQQNAVHLANLHKVKGLEAPIVILAAAAKPKNKGGDSRILYQADGTKGYLFKLKEAEKGFMAPTLIETKRFEDEETDEKTSLSAERDRHIYVAATRAENALIISESRTIRYGNVSISSKWEALLNAGSAEFPFEEQTVEALPEREAVSAEALYEAPEEALRELRDKNWEAGFEVRTPSHVELPSRLTEPEEERESGEPEEATPIAEPERKLGEEAPVSEAEPAPAQSVDLHRRLATTLGTMAHRLMEIIVSSAFRLSPQEAAGEVLSECGEDLSATDAQALRDVLQEAGRTMFSGGYPQENGSAQDLFAELKTAQEIHCELPFTYLDNAETPPVLWDGVMDLAYKKADKWFIVDYKTNADGRDLDAHYREQLEAYRKAFFALTGEDAEARIYHLAI